MKIIIAGAGAVGFHLTELLANENQDITLIDNDDGVLRYASSHSDILTIKGDAASIKTLEKAEIRKAQLFLAVTASDSTNLLAAVLAKQLGAKKVIARVSNVEYLEPEEREQFEKLGVDSLFSPPLLAAQEIQRLLERCSFTDIFEFEEGQISVIGFTVYRESHLVGQTLEEIDNETPHFPFQAIALLRGTKTHIPNGNTRLQSGDHLYLVTTNEKLDQLTKFLGMRLKKVKNVMILGGTYLALRAAQLLENQYNLTLVEKDEDICKSFLEDLHNTLIINADPDNVDVLKEEGLAQMDAFIALTPNSETNIITSLMAKEAKVYKTIAAVENAFYTHISQNIGVDTLINKKLIAANNIFRFVRKGRVEAIAGLHGVDAEVIEYVVHKSNRLIKHPLKKLHLPEGAVIAGVIRGKKGYIPDGDFTLELNDKVIVSALPEAIGKVENLFQ